MVPAEGMGMFNFQALPDGGNNGILPEWPLIMPTGGAEDLGTRRLDPVVAALTGNTQHNSVTGNRQDNSYEPVIDPVLLDAGHQLPTPRQSVTPSPSSASGSVSRPKPRPRGQAAATRNQPDTTMPQSNTPIVPPARVSLRKRAMTADTLAAAEARRIGNSNGKRQRKPAARALGTQP